MLNVLCVSHVIEVGDGTIFIREMLLLCLKGDYFLIVVCG